MCKGYSIINCKGTNDLMVGQMVDGVGMIPCEMPDPKTLLG